MWRMTVRPSRLTIATFAVIAAGPARGADYVITDLGTLGPPDLLESPGSRASALGASGSVVGRSSVADGTGITHAFLWSDGVMIDLPPIGDDPHSLALATSGADVLGISYELGSLTVEAVRWDGAGVPTPLGAFTPRGANGAGIVVGGRATGTLLSLAEAVRWEAGVLTALPTLGGSFGSAAAIDGAGRIVGTATTAGDLSSRPVLWQGGVVSDLDTLGGMNGQALDIGEGGHAVGVAQTGAGGPHAFRYTLDVSGAVLERLDLGVLGGDASAAYAVNTAGDVVGTSDGRAFLWSGGALIDLNDRIPGGKEWTLIHATDIDDAGRICGSGAIGGVFRAFRLVPRDPADLNADGSVAFADLLILLASWGPCPPGPPCPADLNGDGDVGFADILLLLAAWS